MAYIIINAAGLILDLIGFIGIYLLKRKDVRTVSERMPVYKANYFGEADIKTVSKNIIDEVNRRLKDINRAYNEQQRKSIKYFLLVVIGVILQIVSLIYYLIFN